MLARPTLTGAAGNRVLLVEDDPDMAGLVARVLGRYGYAVTVESDGEAAVGRGVGEAFDLLVCDIGLPHVSGWDVLRRIRERRPIRAIALTGYAMDADVRHSADAGFAAHVTKPVDVKTLVAVVERVMRASVKEAAGEAAAGEAAGAAVGAAGEAS